MKLSKRVGLILKETFSSPTKNSYVTEVKGIDIVLREGGVYKNIDLSGAILKDAHLQNINLEGANLSGADLTGADLQGAYLRGAVFEGAVVSGADFTNADTGGEPLEGVKAHTSPIGIITSNAEE